MNVLPDVERIVSRFLRDQPEMAPFEGRIFTEIPSNKAFPMQRLVRWGGTPIYNRPLYIEQTYLQHDVWAMTKREAQDLAQLTRAVCGERLIGAQPDGVITAVTFGTMAFEPDRAFTDKNTRAALARYRFDLYVIAHPLRLVAARATLPVVPVA